MEALWDGDATRQTRQPGETIIASVTSCGVTGRSDCYSQRHRDAESIDPRRKGHCDSLIKGIGRQRDSEFWN